MSNQAVQDFVQSVGGGGGDGEGTEIEETETAFKNIFFHHRPSDDPVQSIVKAQKTWIPDSFIN